MQKVLVDANILLSRTQRDWLFKLQHALPGMFSIALTEDILAETMYHFRRNHPSASGGTIASLVERFRLFAEEIITEYQCDQPYTGSDPNDGHVHAAARDGRCDILLTSDKGFAHAASSPDSTYAVYDADAFFTIIDDSSPRAVLDVVQSMLRYWRDQGREADLAPRLRAAGCPDFAARVEAHTRALA